MRLYLYAGCSLYWIQYKAVTHSVYLLQSSAETPGCLVLASRNLQKETDHSILKRNEQMKVFPFGEYLGCWACSKEKLVFGFSPLECLKETQKILLLFVCLPLDSAVLSWFVSKTGICCKETILSLLNLATDVRQSRQKETWLIRPTVLLLFPHFGRLEWHVPQQPRISQEVVPEKAAVILSSFNLSNLDTATSDRKRTLWPGKSSDVLVSFATEAVQASQCNVVDAVTWRALTLKTYLRCTPNEKRWPLLVKQVPANVHARLKQNEWSFLCQPGTLCSEWLDPWDGTWPCFPPARTEIARPNGLNAGILERFVAASKGGNYSLAVKHRFHSSTSQTGDLLASLWNKDEISIQWVLLLVFHPFGFTVITHIFPRTHRQGSTITWAEKSGLSTNTEHWYLHTTCIPAFDAEILVKKVRIIRGW